MFEFEVQTLRHWRIRLGRWHFRTWRSWFMKLPSEYRRVEFVYEVITWDEDEDSPYGLGAFDTEGEAQKLIALLKAEGPRVNFGINYIGVHARVTDWEFDR